MNSRNHKYTEEEDIWLKSNFENFNYSDLTEKFNQIFNCNVSRQGITSHILYTLKVKNQKSFKFTKEQDEFLKSNYLEMTYEELCKEFNRKFKCNISVNILLYHCTHHLNLYKDTFHRYTEEEEEWLKQNIDSGTYDEITKEFNNRFNTNLTYNCISSKILKGLKLKKKINRGNYTKGERRCRTTLPVGSESFNGQNLYVKISNEINDCKDRRMPSKHDDPNWIRKDYKVWCEHGNKLPEPQIEMLIHLNRDPKDCTIENLYLTTRKINLLMAKNKWYSSDKDITLSGLKWCELFYAMKDKKERFKIS